MTTDRADILTHGKADPFRGTQPLKPSDSAWINIGILPSLVEPRSWRASLEASEPVRNCRCGDSDFAEKESRMARTYLQVVQPETLNPSHRKRL